MKIFICVFLTVIFSAFAETVKEEDARNIESNGAVPACGLAMVAGRGADGDACQPLAALRPGLRRGVLDAVVGGVEAGHGEIGEERGHVLLCDFAAASDAGGGESEEVHGMDPFF